MYDFMAMAALLSIQDQDGLKRNNEFLSELDPEAREYVEENTDEYASRDEMEAWAGKFYEEHK